MPSPYNYGKFSSGYTIEAYVEASNQFGKGDPSTGGTFSTLEDCSTVIDEGTEETTLDDGTVE